MKNLKDIVNEAFLIKKHQAENKVKPLFDVWVNLFKDYKIDDKYFNNLNYNYLNDTPKYREITINGRKDSMMSYIYQFKDDSNILICNISGLNKDSEIFLGKIRALLMTNGKGNIDFSQYKYISSDKNNMTITIERTMPGSKQVRQKQREIVLKIIENYK